MSVAQGRKQVSGRKGKWRRALNPCRVPAVSAGLAVLGAGQTVHWSAEGGRPPVMGERLRAAPAAAMVAAAACDLAGFELFEY